MKKLYIFLVIALLALPQLRAQGDIQVQVTNLVSPMPSSPFSYIDDPLHYFQVAITNNGPAQEVYLTCEFYFNDHRIIYSRDTNVVLPRMLLANGITVLDKNAYNQQFNGRMESDLSYFYQLYGDNLIAQALSLTRLPEGNYQFRLFVHPYPADGTTPTDPLNDNDEPLSFEIVYSGSAPELITPLSEQVNWGANARADSRDRTRKAAAKTTKNESDFGLLTSMGRSTSNRSSLTPQRKLTFRWTPVITSSGLNPQFLYTLKIVAVMPNQNAQDAIDHNPVVVTTSTKNTYCIIDTLQDMKYQFEQGSTYAVQVKAEWIKKETSSAAADLEVIEVANGGKSQVVTFSWGRAKYSISYNEIKAPLDTAWVELRYHDNIQKLLKETKLPTIISPADIVNPDTFDISFSRPGWTSVTGPDINGVEYTARIYNYQGENECTLHQQPITKASQMVKGQYYYLDVEANINYHYNWDTVKATVYYVNGIEADTEADTVRGEADGSVTRHVGKVFLYGTEADRPYATKYETPNVGLRLAADYISDSSCIHLNWYHHYKSKAGDKSSRDKKNSKGLFHTVVYRSIDGGPFVGIASLSSDQESYIDRDIQRGQTVRYFVKLHLTQYKQSKPSNTTRTVVR